MPWVAVGAAVVLGCCWGAEWLDEWLVGPGLVAASAVPSGNLMRRGGSVSTTLTSPCGLMDEAPPS